MKSAAQTTAEPLDGPIPGAGKGVEAQNEQESRGGTPEDREPVPEAAAEDLAADLGREALGSRQAPVVTGDTSVVPG
jgi:hypothetical protein